MAKTPTKPKPVDEAKAQDFKERAEADIDPVETAQQRLERLEKETKATLDAARKEAREEKAKAAAEEEEKVLTPLAEEITKLLTAAEEKTGKVFRNFSFYYKFKKDAEKPEVKTTHSLVTPRGESTEDENEDSNGDE